MTCQPTTWVCVACAVTVASAPAATWPSSAGRLGGAVLTPGALTARDLPTGQGLTVRDLPTRRGGVEVAEAGRLEGARWWRRRMVASGGSGELLRHR
jgi:hypothetical protein